MAIAVSAAAAAAPVRGPPPVVTEKNNDKKDQNVVVVVSAVPLDDGSDGITPAGPGLPLPDSDQPAREAKEADEAGEAGEPDEDTFPDGGLRAWLVVFGGWCGLFGSMGILNSMSVFNAYISEHQLAAYSPATTGWIWSLFMFLALFPGIYVGPIFDTHGALVVVGPGAVLLVLGVLLSSWATRYWHFILCFSILSGLGASMIFGPSVAAVGHWFRARRGLGLALVGTGSVASGIVFPLLLRGLLPRLGFAWAMRALALVELVVLAVAAGLVRGRLAPPAAGGARPSLRIFFDPAFLATAAADFFMELAVYTPITYLSSYALAAGHGEAMAYTVVSILNGASVLGRASPGLAADRVGPFNCVLATISLSAVAVAAVLLPAGHTLTGLVSFAVLYGFATGACLTLTPCCVARLCDSRSLGRYYAGMYALVSWGYLFGTPLAGAIISAKGYGGIFVFTTAVYGLALVLFLAVRVSRVGWAVRKNF